MALPSAGAEYVRNGFKDFYFADSFTSLIPCKLSVALCNASVYDTASLTAGLSYAICHGSPHWRRRAEGKAQSRLLFQLVSSKRKPREIGFARIDVRNLISRWNPQLGKSSDRACEDGLAPHFKCVVVVENHTFLN
jgi:hypothetical protein